MTCIDLKKSESQIKWQSDNTKPETDIEIWCMIKLKLQKQYKVMYMRTRMKIEIEWSV